MTDEEEPAPEICALPLPEGYRWNMFHGDPRAWNDGHDKSSGWVNYVNTNPHIRSIRLPNGYNIEYPNATLLELCKALSVHMLLLNHD